MRKLHKLLPAVALALASQQAAMGFILHEPFNYPVGDLTQGAVASGSVTVPYVGSTNPWGPTWEQTGSTQANDNVAVISPGLTGPQAWMAGTGNTGYVANGGNASRIGIGPFITPQSGSETVYYSLSLKITDASALGAPTVPTGTTIVAFNNLQDRQTNVPGIMAARLVARRHESDTTKFQLGINKKNDGTTVWETDGNAQNVYRDVNSEYFVVGGYTLLGESSSTSADDEVRLWIDPDVSTFGADEASRPAPTLFSTNSTDIWSTAAGVNQVRIESLTIQQRGAATPALESPNGIHLDEIRIDTRWAGVAPAEPKVWSGSSGATWSSGGNWGGSAPNAHGAVATFAAAGAPTSVNLDVAAVVGTLNFNSAQPYTIGGSGSLTLNGSPTIHVSDGSHAVTAPVIASDDLTVTVATGKSVSLSDFSIASGKRLTKAGYGKMSVNNVRADSVRMFGGTLEIAQNGTDSGVSVIRDLVMMDWTPAAANPIPGYTYDYRNPSRIDLRDNALITGDDIGTWNGTTSSYTGITGLIARGRNEGTWDGPGIMTSMPDATTDYTTLGVATASDVLGIGPAETDVWRGQTVTGSDTIVMYTYGGDANLDGQLNIDDYGQIDFNVGLSGVVFGYINGDFNLDGLINIDDYGIIDFNIGIQGPPFGQGGGVAGVAAVPEPTGLALAGVTLAGLLRRRRRSA